MLAFPEQTEHLGFFLRRAARFHPQGLEPLLPLLIPQAIESAAKLELHVLRFELLFEQSRLIPLEQVAEFSCVEMINDDVSVRFRVLAAEFGNGSECTRLGRALIQQPGRKFLRERRLGNQALQ